MFTLTSNASQEIQAAAARSDAAGLALRVAARRGADGSVEYGMGFDEPREGDMPLQVAGVNLLIALPSQPMLEDIVLDFVEIEPGKFNFIFADRDTVGADAAPKACGNGACNGCSS